MKIYGVNGKTYETYKSETKVLDYVYLHGILEEENGFDLVGVTEEVYNVLSSCYFGKFDVSVILQNGNKEDGILFFWHNKNGRRRGLIVKKTDEKSETYAREMFNKKSNVL